MPLCWQWAFALFSNIPALTDLIFFFSSSASFSICAIHCIIVFVFCVLKLKHTAQKVWIALEAAGAPYEMTEVELYGPGGKPDWFWELNPDGTVPVLVCHGGAVVLPDSDVALDQIANGSAVNIGEKSSGSNQNDSLSAVDEKKDAKLLKSIDQWRTSINNMLPIGKKAVLGGKKDKLFDILQEMDDRVVGPYLCGEKVTVADCAAFPFLWRLNDEFGLDKYRNLISWLKTCNAKPAFSKTVQSSWWWWW